MKGVQLGIISKQAAYGLQNLCCLVTCKLNLFTINLFQVWIHMRALLNKSLGWLQQYHLLCLWKKEMEHSKKRCQFQQLPWHCRPIQAHHHLETTRQKNKVELGSIQELVVNVQTCDSSTITACRWDLKSKVYSAPDPNLLLLRPSQTPGPTALTNK